LASKGTLGYNDGTARSLKLILMPEFKVHMTGSESILRPCFCGVGAMLLIELSFDKDFN
jgi:hypothetical protein